VVIKASARPSSPADGLLPDLVLGHTVCALGRLGQLVLREIDRRLLEHFDLRSRHVGVLMGLRELGPTSQQKLGSAVRLDPATMVTTLNDLESLGLVRRDSDVNDRRRHAVKLTEAGTRTLAAAERVLDEIDEQAMSVLPPRLQRALDQAIWTLGRSPELDALLRGFT